MDRLNPIHERAELESLRKECDDLRSENRRLRSGIIRSAMNYLFPKEKEFLFIKLAASVIYLGFLASLIYSPIAPVSLAVAGLLCFIGVWRNIDDGD